MRGRIVIIERIVENKRVQDKHSYYLNVSKYYLKTFFIVLLIQGAEKLDVISSLKLWLVCIFDWLMFINFSLETTKTAAKLQISVVFTQAIYFFQWPFNKNESLIMNFTVHYKFSSMMTKDDDQVEAKGTGVIWTANQIVTYTTIETDIKVNSKTLESLTILKTWF